MKLELTCPIHKEVTLFVEYLHRPEFMVFGQAEVCPKCKRSYFKEECIPKVLRDDEDGR